MPASVERDHRRQSGVPNQTCIDPPSSRMSILVRARKKMTKSCCSGATVVIPMWLNRTDQTDQCRPSFVVFYRSQRNKSTKSRNRRRLKRLTHSVHLWLLLVVIVVHCGSGPSVGVSKHDTMSRSSWRVSDGRGAWHDMTDGNVARVML